MGDNQTEMVQYDFDWEFQSDEGEPRPMTTTPEGEDFGRSLLDDYTHLLDQLNDHSENYTVHLKGNLTFVEEMEDEGNNFTLTNATTKAEKVLGK